MTGAICEVLISFFIEVVTRRTDEEFVTSVLFEVLIVLLSEVATSALCKVVTCVYVRLQPG